MSESPIFYAPSDDPEMRAANETAQRTFRFLWRELAWEARRIVPGLELAAIKLPFCDAPGQAGAPVEQMWCSEVDFDGVLITAVLLNDPHELRSVSAGDPVVVRLEEISDWMYAQEGRVYGAHTVNLMRRHMPAAERRGHDRAWGLDFGDPEVIEVVPARYLGEPPGLLGRVLGKSAPDVDPGDVEHPMAVNMAPKLAGALATDPTIASQPDERGFTLLHHQALAGDVSGVRVLLEHGADRHAKTAHGMTARDLAATLGWTAVVRLFEAS